MTGHDTAAIPVVSWPDGGLGGCWDHGIVIDLIDGVCGRPPRWPTLAVVDEAEAVAAGGAIVHVSGQHHVDDIARLQALLDRLGWVLLIVTSDEEHLFPIDELAHRNWRVWRQYARPDVSPVDRLVPAGAPGYGASLGGHWPPRDLGWVFAGQVTTARRRQWFAALRARFEKMFEEASVLVATRGFADGISRDDYLRLLRRAQVAPCPAGAAHQDTFRVYEALEAGAVPIVDARRPELDDIDVRLWTAMFREPAPFPVLNDPAAVARLIGDVRAAGDWNRLRVGAWWSRERRALAVDLVATLDELGAELPSGRLQDLVSFYVSVSPVDARRQRPVLDETLGSLPSECEVVVGFDGVRPEDDGLAGDYRGNVGHLLNEWRTQRFGLVPYLPEGWRHQAGTAAEALGLIETPFVCFVEHDTPLVGEIPWAELVRPLDAAAVDVIRLHYADEIHPEHEYLMGQVEQFDGVPLRDTTQWSQRPHLARTAWYRLMLAERFGPDDRSMIEDAVYSPGVRGELGRVTIYHPPGSLRRSAHIDGRGDLPKHPMVHGGKVIG